MDDDSLFSYFVVVESISESIVHWNKSWQIAIFSFCLSCFSYSCLIFANFNSDLNGNIWFIKEWNLIFQFFWNAANKWCIELALTSNNSKDLSNDWAFCSQFEIKSKWNRFKIYGMEWLSNSNGFHKWRFNLKIRFINTLSNQTKKIM